MFVNRPLEHTYDGIELRQFPDDDIGYVPDRLIAAYAADDHLAALFESGGSPGAQEWEEFADAFADAAIAAAWDLACQVHLHGELEAA